MSRAEQRKINTWFDTHQLTQGVGSAESACIIAGVNIALTGTVTDLRPHCMSAVIHAFAIQLHDSLSPELLVSPEYRQVAKRLADTGNTLEPQRLNLISNWMWENIFPHFQPLAEKDGVADLWRQMLIERSASTADAIADAATATGLNSPACVARAASRAAHALETILTEDTQTLTVAAQIIGEALGTAAWAAREDRNRFWATANPIALLQSLPDIATSSGRGTF